jgi:hypothetical protein
MNKAEFFDQLSQAASLYDQDNEWFGFQRGGPAWSRGTWIQFILAAWKLYQNAASNQLQMILLGDTKIRSDASLLFNFGLAANTNAPQEDKDRLLVSELMNKRRGLAPGGAVEIMGPGSILSAKRWSPALNDALMLGGIHTYQDFHFALNGDEQETWRELTTRPGSSNPEFAKRIAQFGAVVRVKNTDKPIEVVWLDFFHKVPRVFWENGNPRVFVRELMGLKFFGYKAVFTRHELGFIYKGGGRPPTFLNYLKALREVGLERRDRFSIMRHIGEFLFNDEKALGRIGA